MITEKSKNLIKEEMLNLPKEVQDAINASAWEKISEEIGKKYLLDEGEINIFQLETASLLLGLVDEDSYPINIEEEVGTGKEEAIKIADEAFQKIFTPIKNIAEENIKKNLKNKNPNPAQTLDFILSGGDYSAFMEQREPVRSEAPIVNKTPATPIAPPSLADIKANVHPSSRAELTTGQGKQNIPANKPLKMTDLKSKFTI